MASPSICFGYETALQILRTTDPRERTLLRSGAHTMPDRAPSMCAFGRPRIARNVAPIHDARTTCASSGVSRIPMPIYKRFHGARMQNDRAGTPASPTWQRRIRKRCTPRLRAYSSSRDQHDRTARTRLRTVRLLSNQTNRHIIRLPGRTPVIDSRPCRLRHTKPVASRRNPKPRKPLLLPCRQLGSPRETKKAILLGLP